MRHLRIVTLIALIMAAIGGCKQKEVEPTYYVYATVGTESFKFEGSTYLASSSGSYSNTFVLAAYPDANTQLMFTTATPLTKAPATLKIDFSSYYGGTNKSYYGTSGTCTINSFDGKTVEGTFSFDATSSTGTGTIKVKDGRFRLKYT